ncbi:hypothetical protein Mesil_1918 [Allomeiothermus silvanus DSM 9946]|uniref:Uncharacterized protein n=1 Tax=Allomeiothermus silvanus (strain ATCC 700542 / DSM 9946 / NBRC 106475 / NCIMB 13440 / VI-R2) TaxID=526227 RepID=D7BGH7_ALLS1|nr:hypothetical protein Mesil_1918 [Allomeiothermus silvanus DSM 9946]
MTETLLERLRAELPRRVKLELGPDALNQHEGPLKLVLVPGQDTFTPPDTRAIAPEALARETLPQPRPRPPYTRLAGYTLHIWAKSYQAVEDILSECVAALRRICGSSLELLPSGWDEDETGQAAALPADKRRYQLRFRVLVEVGAAEPGLYVRLERALLDQAEILP